jgi:hypothetical protein
MQNFSLRSGIQVCKGFREEDIWRGALGPNEPLLCFAMLGGPLDAPDVLPAGGMRRTDSGAQRQMAAVRAGAHD